MQQKDLILIWFRIQVISEFGSVFNEFWTLGKTHRYLKYRYQKLKKICLRNHFFFEETSWYNIFMPKQLLSSTSRKPGKYIIFLNKEKGYFGIICCMFKKWPPRKNISDYTCILTYKMCYKPRSPWCVSMVDILKNEWMKEPFISFSKYWVYLY